MHDNNQADSISNVTFDRHRRLRTSPAIRALLKETILSMNDLVYPIFVEEGIDDYAPIPSMPGVNRIPESMLGSEMKALEQDGIRAVLVFGVSHNKDETGSDSLKDSGLLARIISTAKKATPDMLVISDTCFCEYTTHGHCGIIHDGVVQNDETIQNLAKQAVIAAKAGADIIAPSAMMDGQVALIRNSLDLAGYSHIPIMAYSSKFASCFYGPFREASGCSLEGDRKTYQLDSGNGREALRESASDAAQGADFLMVKPGLPYLDVLARIRDSSLLPLAVYQVSGEYSMIKAAAEAGYIDERSAVIESLLAFKRAGADLIITYFARYFAVNGLDKDV